jgi:photosystem II stability/assembly factor-like uncharacterized protein
MAIRDCIRGAVLTLPLVFAAGIEAQDAEQAEQAEQTEAPKAEYKRYDVLSLPAAKSDLAAEAMVYVVRKFGDRYFAGGIRGHILYSDDGGESWTQASVPVRSGILDIHFPSPEKGWAVGHEAVILHTDDGGETWEKQYDGLQLVQDAKAFYTEALEQVQAQESKQAEESDQAEETEQEQGPDPYYLEMLKGEMEFAESQGASNPLFKIYCFTDIACNAIGAYGLAIRTRDGGKSWEPTMHNNENDTFYHTFDFAPLPGDERFFLAGEAGTFLIASVGLLGNPERQGEGSAVRVNSVPWEGSFFASSDTAEDAVVMGGLRGRMFHTADEGDTWVVVDKPDTSTIVDIIRLADDRLVAAGVAGEILISTDNGFTFKRADVAAPRINSIAEGPDNSLIVGGPGGLSKVTLP